jgi:hypothetical protein
MEGLREVNRDIFKNNMFLKKRIAKMAIKIKNLPSGREARKLLEIESCKTSWMSYMVTGTREIEGLRKVKQLMLESLVVSSVN